MEPNGIPVFARMTHWRMPFNNKQPQKNEQSTTTKPITTNPN